MWQPLLYAVSNLLPAPYAAPISLGDGRLLRGQEINNTVAAYVKAFSKLSVAVQSYPVKEQLHDRAEEDDIEWRHTIDDDTEIKETLVENALQDVNLQEDGHAEEKKEIDESYENDIIVTLLPSEPDIVFHFPQKETISVWHLVIDDMYHVQKARAALLRAKRTERRGRTCQMLIKDFMSTF